MRDIVRLLRVGLDGLVGLVVLLGGPARVRARADAARARFTPPLPAGGAWWRDAAWLATPLGSLLTVFWLDLFAAGLMGLAMPLLWALEDDGRLWYQWVIVDDFALAVFAMPVGALMIWIALLLVRPFLRVERWRTRRLLAPTLADRVEWLTATRSAALDASASELRRIERDLHDGAQAQLVAVSMQLGMAEDMLDRDPAAARDLLLEARSGANTAMAELRALVRGIHPPLLAERGLGGALEALALRSAVPVTCSVSLTRRLPAPIESALYFSAVELLTNAIRHSGAARVSIEVAERDGRVVLRVRDDGRGGAVMGAGSGLSGLASRLAPFDGVLRVSSPAGGPTVVVAEVPCASS
ncbi:sensor histidine kinase [Solirubrobacter sp. CPCC 204708]|uniref:histidine kinase n=1 Tax=Solirubrobacter deserti TaxID=2282478 RepID=A0ABT4RSF3_9ACTN|nr:sensor histidine kinase [Solirubrobacter deserti]MBE2318723.1 sensor histidine kinase [Solirubrobacter deserti]MDA0141313.1 sensor histidine kinase [Solirubrobacter deserti]